MKNISLKNVFSFIRDLKDIEITQRITSHTCIRNKDQNHCKSCQINFSISLLRLVALAAALILAVSTTALSIKCIFCKPKTKKEENCCN